MNEIITKDKTLSFSNVEDVGKSLTEKNPAYNYRPDFTIDNQNSGTTETPLQNMVNNLDIDTIWASEKKKENQQIIEKKLKRVYNLSIVELAVKMGSVEENPSDKMQGKIIDNYWNFMANVILGFEPKERKQ